jgi:hypothetical protein
MLYKLISGTSYPVTQVRIWNKNAHRIKVLKNDSRFTHDENLSNKLSTCFVFNGFIHEAENAVFELMKENNIQDFIEKEMKISHEES